MNNLELKPIVLKTCLGFCYFRYDQILMIQAQGNCSLVYAVSETDPVRVLHNLNFISRKYCNRDLFRCHKSFIINLMHIKNLEIKSHRICLTKDLTATLSHEGLRILKENSLKLNSKYYER